MRSRKKTTWNISWLLLSGLACHSSRVTSTETLAPDDPADEAPPASATAPGSAGQAGAAGLPAPADPLPPAAEGPPPADAGSGAGDGGGSLDTATPVGGDSSAGDTGGGGSVAPERVRILFDTDMGPDCDDAGTQALMWALAKQGYCEPLGAAATVSSPWAAPTIAAINHYYGAPDLPVGTLKQPGFLMDSLFSEGVAKNFPNRIQHGSRAPDAVQMYRETLARQPDRSVTMVATGPQRNLRNLLRSAADGASPLSGRELIATKVIRLVVMGGRFPTGGEWNIQQDVPSAQIVASEWPSPVVYSGGEVGGSIRTGHTLRQTPASNPVRRAYELARSILDANFNRPSWDQTAMLFAIRGGQGLFTLSEPGTVQFEGNGNTRFTPGAGGRHRYLRKVASDREIAEIIERLMSTAP